MIVKNESKIITRLLESVVNIIDCFCICDTGSTDSTIDVICDFFLKHNIPGVIIIEAFRDFGYNRSYALSACQNIDVKYILLMDADMVLKYETLLTKSIVTHLLIDDVYYLYQGTASFCYKNVRIVRNKMNISYWGVTHEYVNTPPNTRYGTIEKSVLFIYDIGDGGSKKDKFERDILLLKKGLEANPNNDRYTFYLANSYRDAGQLHNAIETYKKRIEIGGWKEEVWHSCYSIGKCYSTMNQMEHALYWYLEAHNVIPERLENLYEIIHYYREKGKNHIAYSFYVMARAFLDKNKNPDYLFLQKDVYDYKLDYELSIIGYYCNYNNYDILRASMNVLNCDYIDDSIRRNVMMNYKFYAHEISRNKGARIEDDFELGKILRDMKQAPNDPDFVSSTPSIVKMKNGDIAVNVRYVNYRITENGGYKNGDHITTINVIAIVNMETKQIIREFVLDYDKSLDGQYVGLEDVRLFYYDRRLYFNANRGVSGTMWVEHGTIDLEDGKTNSCLLKIEGQRNIEKNWVMFEAKRQIYMIYEWYPIVYGNISGNVFEKMGEIATPASFRGLRGSTNGCLISSLSYSTRSCLEDVDEVWFLCHAVSYEERRYYYHMWVVLDGNTFELKKYSPYFTFQKEKVEYALGLYYNEDANTFVIGYSILDRETHYMEIDKAFVDAMMLK